MNNHLSLNYQALLNILSQSNQATAIYIGLELRIEFVNDAMLKLWGKESSVIGRTFQEALPEMAGQPFAELLKQVWLTGDTYTAKDTLATLNIGGQLITSYFDFVYKAIKDDAGEIQCVLHTASDVTDRVIARKSLFDNEQKLQEYNEELMVLNEELQATNEELATLNEEYTATNEQLEDYNQEISQLNTRLENNNEELQLSNKGFEKRNTGLSESNDTLILRNSQLQALNEAITAINGKLTNSENSFKNLIAQSPIAILLVKGKNFIVHMINQPMLELLGRDEQIIGKPLFEQIPELLDQQVACRLNETFETGGSCMETSIPVKILREGKVLQGYFNFSYTPYIEDGKVTGVIDMAVDITTQVRAIKERDKTIRKKNELEQTLKINEQRLQGILETMAEGVGIINATGELIYANPMAQQILGLTQSEIEDRTFYDQRWKNLRLDGTDLPEDEHPMSIMMATGKQVFDMEIGVQSPGRDRIFISINAAPIFDKQGNLTGGIGTFMDVTARRMITQGKEDFISIASHELKTPVTSLKASLQLLQRANERLTVESRDKLISQSMRSLDNLSHLINDLLDTSRMERGHMTLEKKSITLSNLFDECCSHVGKNGSQEIVFEGLTAQNITADDQQIGQVLVNLITNAIKYAPDSEKIIVRADKISNSEIKISVKDFGPGIPEEKLKYLFERYYRTDYKGQKFTGLGLGLYISAEIIKNHGGKIGANSELGKGSEFWFTLPIDPYE